MRIDFDEVAHAYALDGEPVPSVSQALRLLEDFEAIPPATLERARRRGQYVHEAVALLVREALDWESLDSELVPYLVGAQRFLAETDLTVIASEVRVASRKLRVAGTADLLSHWRKSEALFDFKATAAVPRSVGPQLAAYDALYRETFGGRARRRYCVQLKPNDYRVVPLTDPADMSIFVSCLNVWRYKHAS